MYFIIGWGTLIGALMGASVPVLQFLLLRARVANTFANPNSASREEVADIFALQGVYDLYAEKDRFDVDGTRHLNVLHRVFVFLHVVKYPALVCAMLGLLVENLAGLF